MMMVSPTSRDTPCSVRKLEKPYARSIIDKRDGIAPATRWARDVQEKNPKKLLTLRPLSPSRFLQQRPWRGSVPEGAAARHPAASDYSLWLLK